MDYYLRKAIEVFSITLTTLTMVSCSWLNAGQVYTAKRAKNPPLIVVGPVENRDPKYNPHLGRNLADRLVFELFRRGYDPYLASDEQILKAMDTKETASKLEPSRPALPAKEPTEGALDEEDIPTVVEPTILLPDRFRNLAGETQPSNQSSVFNRLGSSEVIRLAKLSGMKFFIQTAISRTEQGVLLDVRENTFIFLEVWSSDGRRLGLVHYNVHDRTLQEAKLLDEVGPDLADEIIKIIASEK